MEINIPTRNNFDLIRLFAAVQVVIRHLFYNQNFDNVIISNLIKIVMFFPGVPIFFTISGFLIFWSYDRENNNKKYFFNRFLRIYPGLWLCLIITIIFLILSDKDAVLLKNFEIFILWIFGQATVIQFWTPHFLRFWGEGIPNGSLWTIFVEIQFYFFIPIFYVLTKKFHKNKIYLIIGMSIASVLLNYYLGELNKQNIFHKLGFIFLFTYLFYFLNGIMFYIFWDKLKNLFLNKFLVWLFIFIIINYLVSNYDIDLNNYYITNPIKYIYTIILSATVISGAFSYGNVSANIIGKNDISYGVYLYHMVIINLFNYYGWLNGYFSYFVMLFVIIIFASFSWFWIEKKALIYKLR